MKKISKFKNVLLSLAVLSTASYGADEFKLFPMFTDENYKANFEFAVVAGSIDFKGNNTKSGTTYGVDLSFDCPVFTLPGNNLLRQQLSLNRYDKNGVEITTIEMNPYYFIDISDDLTFGFGPGIGGMKVNTNNTENKWLFAYQAGAGLKYYIDKILVGIDARYQWTSSKDLGAGTKEDLDNMRVLLKVGYAF